MKTSKIWGEVDQNSTLTTNTPLKMIDSSTGQSVTSIEFGCPIIARACRAPLGCVPVRFPPAPHRNRYSTWKSRHGHRTLRAPELGLALLPKPRSSPKPGRDVPFPVHGRAEGVISQPSAAAAGGSRRAEGSTCGRRADRRTVARQGEGAVCVDSPVARERAARDQRLLLQRWSRQRLLIREVSSAGFEPNLNAPRVSAGC